MTVQKLIEMAEKRIAYLLQSRINAEGIGDIDAVTRIDTDIAETQATLNQLKSIPTE